MELTDRTELRVTLESGLMMLEEMQKVVSRQVPGAVPDGWPTKEVVRTYALALVVEVAELIQTLEWKPWRNRNEIASLREAPEVVATEFADVLAFLGLMILYLDKLGISPGMLADAYLDKSLVNIRRITDAWGDNE